MAYQLQITTAQGTQTLPLEGVTNSSTPADPSASYTLLDEQGNAVTENLSLTKDGNNLSLEVDGESVANIEEFYSVDGSQYVIDGSAVPAENMVISSAGVDASGSIIANGAVWQAESSFLGLSTLQLVGAGVGSAVALGAAAASGSDSSSSSTSNADVSAPEITSGTTASNTTLTAIDENSGANQVVYTVTATDDNDITYSLSGDDASLFTIDSSTGEVTLTADPDYETKDSYSFNVVATDEAGNESEQAVSLDINDLDDTAPTNTFTDAAYDETSNTLTLTGTAMNTLLSVGESNSTDIKDNFNWDNFTWDIDSDNDDSNNVSFSLSDIESVYVTDDNTLAITLTDTAATSLESTTDFDALTDNDSVSITEGFSADTTGNVSTTDSFERDTSIVVFDLVNGESSSHSDRSFDANESYTIYIMVQSESETLNFDSAQAWGDASNLGSDDLVILVGDGSDIMGFSNSTIQDTFPQNDSIRYISSGGTAATLSRTGSFVRYYSSQFDTVRLWSNDGTPSIQAGAPYSLTTMPTGILTSQGLAQFSFKACLG